MVKVIVFKEEGRGVKEGFVCRRGAKAHPAKIAPIASCFIGEVRNFCSSETKLTGVIVIFGEKEDSIMRAL